MRSLHIPALLLCLVLAFGAGLSAQAGHKSLVGQTAPDFSLKSPSQQSVRLSEFRGKVVLLDFWATWCTPCQTEVPHFVAMQEKYGKDGFQVIGISMDDSPEPVKKFYAKFKMNYPVGMGTPQAAESYGGVLGLPLAFLIDRDGQIVKQYEGAVDLDKMEADVLMLLKEKGTNTSMAN